MWWLLEEETRKEMVRALASGWAPTAAQQAEYSASFDRDDSRILSVAGNTAEIAVRGLLTRAPNFMALLFGEGNTTYGEIVQALAQANASTEIQKIELAIDSPGGQFEGLFDVIAAIQNTSKPVDAVIQTVGASAAYAIASQANNIRAASVASRIGSIGVAATFATEPNEVTVTSTHAPDKRPDIMTEEGKAIVRVELDAMHDIFVDAIAQGRNVSAEKINADFGRGATVLAGEALKRGMIDSMAQPNLRIVSAANTKLTAHIGGDKPEAIGMDLITLKAQHPDVYAAVMQLGVTQERDRVTAHILMGEASGDTATAFAAVKDGSGMTETLKAQYAVAGMNRGIVNAAVGDDAAAAAALGNAADPAESDAKRDAEVVSNIIAEAASLSGVTLEG